MRKFLLGLGCGLAIGTASAATAAELIGKGYLTGWSVTKNGDEICYMPYIWTATKEIECD